MWYNRVFFSFFLVPYREENMRLFWDSQPDPDDSVDEDEVV